MDIHKQLKAIRKKAGLSQVNLAKAARCEQKQVSLIEGGNDCYLSTIRSLLGALGYDLAAVPVEIKEGGKVGE